MATINGTPNNDTINGTSGDDDIFGLEGRDTINGNNGNDRIDLGIGDRGGNQSANGGNGDDTLIGGESDDDLNGGADNDLLFGNGGDDILDGGAGDDTVYGGTGDDTFNDASVGNDTLFGGDGQDYFQFVSYNNGQSTISGGAGVDTFNVYGDISRGGSLANWGPDTITDFQAGDDGDILLLSQVTNDFSGWDGTSNPFLNGFLRFSAQDLDGDGNIDDLAFQIDRDGATGGGNWVTFLRLLNVDANDFTVQNFTQNGNRPSWSPDGVGITYTAPQERDGVNQSVHGSEDADVINGSVEREYIETHAGDDIVNAGGGNDTIYTYEGNDTVDGGAGDDYIDDRFGGSGDDNFSGGTGNDTIYSGTGNDIVSGGDGNDNIYDGAGDDTYDGGAGDDYFQVTDDNNSSSGDRYTGGSGRDRYFVSLSTMANAANGAAVITDFAAGDGGDYVELGNENLLVGLGDQNPFAAGYLRLNVQDVDGDGNADDVMLQADFDGAGNGPWVNIIGFADTVPGDFGVNFTFSTSQQDFFGPTGVGRTNVIDGFGNTNLAGTRDDDTLIGGDTNDTFNGYRGDDTLIGNRGNDNLDGHQGNDTLSGGEGNDTLSDGDGDDFVDGGAGNDTIYVQNGNDTIIGGTGDDYIGLAWSSINSVFTNTIDAGEGNDRIDYVTYDASTDNITLGAGIDRIDLDNQIFSNPNVVVDRIMDFVGGREGDYVYLNRLMSSFQNYTTGDNPFVTGHLQLVQTDLDGDGADDTVLRVDRNGGADAADLIDVLEFIDILPGDFNGWNFTQSFTEYFDPTPASPTPGENSNNGGFGSSTVQGTEFDDILIGGRGSDNISGYDGDDVLTGNEGNDTLNGGEGSDVMDGGRGDDQFYVAGGDDNVTGGLGNDTVYVYTNGNSTIDTGDGDDVVTMGHNGTGQTGTTTIDLGTGNDTFNNASYDQSDDTVTLGDGSDRVDVHRQRLTDAAIVADTITDFQTGEDGDFLYLNDLLTGLSGWSSSTNPFATGFLRLIAGDADGDGNADDTLLQADQNGASGGANFVTILNLLDVAPGDFEAFNLTRTTTPQSINWINPTNIYDPDPATNVAPTATASEIVTLGNTTTSISLGWAKDLYDADGDAVTATLVTGPAQGTITLNANGSISFNATGAAPGTYSFVYDLSDGTATTQLTGSVTLLANNAQAFTFTGSDDADNLAGVNGNDTLNGEGGNDSISGGDGNDVLNGGDGNDSLSGGNQDDTLNGDAGNDTLDGNAGNDTLNGGDGDDVFNDDQGNNVMSGGAGDDTFNNLGYRDGVDTVTGGSGRDLFDLELFYFFNASTTDQAVDTITDFEAGPGGDYIFLQGYTNYFQNFDPGTDNPFSTGHLQLMQNGANEVILRGSVDGTAGNLQNLLILQNSGGILVGDFTIDNFLASGVPNNVGPSPTGVGTTITGTTGNDNFDGSNDGDIINADPNPTGLVGGNDNINGRNGDDTINGGAGNDTLYGDEGDDTLNGNLGDDSLNGGNGDDELNGGDGNDTLNGNLGDDTLNGGDGNDVFNDDQGNNIINGGAGDDTINNLGYRTGVDTVTGGAGRDTFDLEIYYPLIGTTNTAVDTVTDFEAGPDGDYINLQGYTNYFQNFDDNSQNPFATGHLQLMQNGPNEVILRGSVDGTAGNLVDMLILQNSGGLLVGDFTVDNFLASGQPNGVGPSPTGTGLTITGTPFDDDFDGTNDADTIYGDPDATGALGSGDTIRGQDGNDMIFGHAGGDNLSGNEGNDQLFGGEGNDSLHGGNGDDLLDGGADDDTLSGDNGNDTLFGGDGDDSINGDVGDDIQSGGAGDDFFGDYRGTNTFDGGDGDDYFQYALYSYGSQSQAAVHTITGGAGSDLLDLYAASLFYATPQTWNSLTVTDFEAGPGGDVLRMQDLSSLFPSWDQTSNPFSQGFLGFSMVDADNDGQVDDTRFWADETGATDGQQLVTVATLLDLDFNDLTAANFSTTNYGAGAFWEPDGSVRVIMGSERPENNQWNPSIVGSLASDQIFGGAGDEFIQGFRGNDEIHGGAGQDNIDGNEGDDMLFGEESDDDLAGNAGNDMLDGGEGDDRLEGNQGDDQLFGGIGDDYLTDNQGTNLLDGGAGADYFGDLSSGSDGGQVTATGGADRDEFYVQPYAFYYPSVQSSPGYVESIITDFEAGSGGDILNLNSWTTGWFTGWDGVTNPFSGGFFRFQQADADSDGQVDDILVQGDYDGLAGGTYTWETGLILLDVDPADIVRSQVLFQGNRTFSQSGADGLPEGFNDAYAVDEDGTLTVSAAEGVLVNDTDPQSDPLTAVLDTNPSNGTLTLNSDGSFTYTPSANFTGNDSFTYRPDDGTSPGNATTVFITVDPENDAPIANPNNYSVDQGDTLSVPDGGTDILANDVDPDGDSLTATLVTGPSNGTLTLNANGSFDYTPNASFTGTDSFTYVANDGTVDSAPANVTINVNADNVAPVTNADSYNGTEDTPITITAPGVLANDTDADSDPLSAELVSGGSGGTVNLNANGSFTFTPNANFNGTGSFTYRANDGTVAGNTVTVSINIAAVNDAPVADQDGPYAATEDSTLNVNAANGVLAGDTDVDHANSSLIAVLVTDVANGTLTLNSDGSFDYTPDADYNGADSFTYVAEDPDGAQSNPITVQINVAPANDAPVGVADGYTVGEDAVLTVPAAGVLGNDTDAENDALTASLVSNVSNGQLTLNSDGSFTYIPTTNFNGTDSFTYVANDGAADSANTTVTITVDAANDQPTAGNDGYNVDEDGTLTVDAAGGLLANDNDIDGDTLSVSLLTDVGNGTLALNGDGSFTYTPDANFNGSDSFTYEVSDGNGGTDTATVNIGVNPVNDLPDAVNDTGFSAGYETPVDINAATLLANDSDIDGDTPTVTSVQGATNGTVALNGSTVTFTPNNGYSGPASFTYTISDGNGGTDTATVSLTVNAPGNSAPSSTADAYSVDEDNVLSVPATGVLSNDSDADSDPLTASLVNDVANGTLTLNSDGSFTYTPDANFNGSDSFTYVANDGTTDGNQVTVSLTVNPVNDVPDATGNAYGINEDETLTVTAPGVLANDSDVDGDTLNASLLSDVSNGTLTLNSDGSFTYTPDANFNGSDSFTYVANDGTTDSNEVTVNLSVFGVNDDPDAVNDSGFSTDYQTPVDIDATALLANDTDVENDTLAITSVQGATNGTVALNGTTVTFTPTNGYSGPASFTYTISDGNGGTDTATVNLTVNSQGNTAPSATGETYSVDEDNVLSVTAPGVLANDTDGESDPLTATLVSDVSNGTLTLNSDGSFSYTPDTDFNGSDSFTYVANDGTADSAPVTVNLTVNPVNDAPTAGDAGYGGTEDQQTAGQLAAEVSDIDGDPLTYSVVGDPANGQISVDPNTGSFTYTPDANFNGTDSFTYVVNDGTTDSNTGTISFNVAAVNDDPDAANDSGFSTAYQTPVDIDAAALLTNDTDVENDTLNVTSVQGATNGTVALNGTMVTFTPDNGYSGAASFTYTISDGNGGTDTATVNLTVQAQQGGGNNAPTGIPDFYTVNEDNVLVTVGPGVLLNDTDGENDPLTATLVSGPSNGTLTFNSDGSFSYTPDADFNGDDMFSYRPNDGSLDGNVTNVSITVNPVNDDPDAVNDGAYNIGYNQTADFLAATLLGNDTDPDGDTLSISSVQGASNGSVALNGSTVSFTPDANYSGPASFTYTISDGNGGSDTATVSMYVQNPPPPPPPPSAQPTEGDDYIFATAADEAFDGLGGFDVVSYQKVAGGVTARLHPSAQDTGAGGVDSFVNIEGLAGSRFNDRLYGNNADNLIRGDQGDDFLFGLGGNDTITGDDGNDTIDGGDGNDKMGGGTGIDTISYLSNTQGVNVSLAITGYQDTGTAGLDQIVQFENLTGSRGDDILTGDANANAIRGAQGDDTILGGGGDDQLFGDFGDDIINGGTGVDTLGGGAGADRFVFDSLDGDIIKDFDATDSIDVSAFAGSDVDIVNQYGRSFVYFDTDLDGQFDDGYFVVQGSGFDQSDLIF